MTSNLTLLDRVTDILVSALFTVEIEDDERSWVKTNVAEALIEELGLHQDERESWSNEVNSEGVSLPVPRRQIRWVTEWERQ